MSTLADRIAALSPEKRALLRQRLAEQQGAPARPPVGAAPRGGIPRRDPAQPLALSHAQERLWFLNRLQRGHAFYNIPLGLDMRGRLDIAALRRALVEITRRHEVLRTTFRESAGRPEQVVHGALEPDFGLIDLGRLPAGRAEEEMLRLAASEAARPFDLETGPLLRATVARLGDERHALLMSIHHTVADGWSRGVLMREIEILYGAFREGRPSPLPDLPIQYGDFAMWQRSWLTGARMEREIAYWRERLEGLAELEIAPVKAEESGAHRGAKYLRILPAARLERVKEFARAHRATPFMVLLAAFQAYLHRLSGQEDVTVGVPTANRNWPETEPLIGFFVNSLVMRTHLGGDPTFLALLERVRQTAVGAFEHRHVPFEKVVEVLRPDRTLGRNPLFQVTFQFQDASYGKQNSLTPSHEFPGLAIERLKIDQGTAVFDLSVNMGEIAEGLAVLVEYATDPWSEERIALLVDHMAALIDDAVRDPERPISRLALTGADERRSLLALASSPARATPEVPPVHLAVARHAAATPDAPAVVAGRQILTYRELDRAANRLAHHLVAGGLRPESVVALCLDREPSWVVAALAALKAGCAYLTLDPADPARRRQAMLEDVGAEVLLTKAVHLDDFAAFARARPGAVLDVAEATVGEANGDEPPARRVSQEQLAYVVYTSGSTGVPKGAGLPHRALTNLLAWHQAAWPVGPGDRGTCLAGLAFDPAVWEVWTALAFGAALHLPDEDLRRDPRRLAAWLADEGITFAYAPTPITERLLLERIPEHSALRVFFVGGDRLTRRPAGFPCPLVNVYGPAENAVNSTAGVVSPASDGALPHIGRPVDGVQAYVLDRCLEPVPIGVVGELYLGGAGLARGYLGRPELTAASFVPDVFSREPGRRLYKTGDRVCMRGDGTLDFVGRRDGQIKVRGSRLELGEVEAALRSHPAVGEAVVLAKYRSGEAHLVAYVTGSAAGADGSRGERDGERVQSWQEFYEVAYGESRGGDRRFDTVGWNSSYDGTAIPRAEMRAWLDETIARIEELGPRRILEVGCGTGMLLFRLAPGRERYCAIDFSRAVIDGLRAELARPGRGLAAVELIEARADEVGERVTGRFDVAVLNSVAQYFPSTAYFEAVLVALLARVAPGGAIFLGDLRHAGLERLFHASIALSRAAESDTAAEILRRVDELAMREQELLLAPTIFPLLASRHPRISRVRVRPKRHTAPNELSRFRYDVVLELDREPAGDGAARAESPVWDWDALGGDLDRVRARLAESAAGAVLRGVPNGRLGEWVGLLAALERAEPTDTLGALRRRRAAVAVDGIDPVRLWTLGDELGCDVDLSWIRGDRDGRVDVLFRPRGPDALPALADGAWAGAPNGRGESLADHASEPALRRNAGALATALRDHLAERLPDYMVPERVIALPSLPLNNNGKVDRARLLALDVDGRPSSVAHVAPRDELEREVAAAFGRVLGATRVGVRDDFFALGGHSLLATQVVAALEEATGIRLDLRVVFTATTVEGIAGALRAAAADRRPVTAIERCDPHPAGDDAGALSSGQERLWFVEQLLPGTAAYNMAAQVRIAGQLDDKALRIGLERLIERHESLRTSFESRGGQVVQVVAASAPLELTWVDRRGVSPEELDRDVRREAARPFDLARAPLVRAACLRVADAEHVLVVTMHHIVSDGWSIGVFVAELAELYRAEVEGRAAALPPLGIRYRDYAAWQRREGAQGAQPEAYAYWAGQLAGAPAHLGLPTDRPRPALPTFEGAKLPVALGAALSRRIDALAQRTGTTRFMVLLAAWQAVLHHHAGADDVVLVSPVAGRRRSETHRVIGFFVNWLALRTSLGGDPSFRELLDRVRETSLGALEHQDVPFERVLEQLRLERQLGTTPFAQVAFALQNAPAEPIRLPGLAIEARALDTRTAKTDLTLLLDEPGAVLGRDAAGFSGVLEYATQLFDESTVAGFASDFVRLLERAVGEPDRSLSRLVRDAELGRPRHQVRGHERAAPPEPIRFYGSSGVARSEERRWRALPLGRSAGPVDVARGGSAAMRFAVAVVAAHLQRISGQERVAIGLAPTGASVVPLVIDVAPDASFRDLIGRVGERLAAGGAGDLPADAVCDAVIAEEAPAGAAGELGGTAALAIALGQGAAGATLRVGFHAEIFDTDLEDLAFRHLSAVAAAAAADLDQPISAAALEPESASVSASAESPATDSATRAIFFDAFDRKRAAAPDAIALIDGSATDGQMVLSYRGLDERVRRLARRLRALGAGREAVVAIALHRRRDGIVALLAVLRSGAAYLPIEAGLPPARVARMLELGRVSLVVTDGDSAGRIPPGPWQSVSFAEAARADVPAIGDVADRIDVADPIDGAGPTVLAEQLAYVLFTSGTTGEPKGVAIEHGALSSFAAARALEFGLEPGDRVLQFASLGFDVSVEEIFAPLASGSAVVVRDDDMVVDPERFLERCRRDGVTVLHLPTAYWQTLVAVLDERGLALPSSLRLLIVGGERLTAEAVRAWRSGAMRDSRRSIELRNSYGPTEVTVSATIHRVPAEPEHPCRQEIPIGPRFGGARLHVIDPRTGRPAPTGVAGELWISGPGVARGYLARPDLTAERFVPDPFPAHPGARAYRSGDLVRRRTDGALEFVGRIDRQVKVRGFRIELEEVERALRAQARVAAGVVMALPAPGGSGLELVAFATPSEPADAEALRRELEAVLPGYMVPNRWVFLDALPLDGHGKVDRRALRAEAERRRSAGAADAPPRDEVERTIAAIWGEALGQAQIGVHQNFFELGGSSLLLLQIHPRLRERLGVSLTLVELFQYPTVHLLAERLRDGVRDDSARVTDRAGRRRAAAQTWQRRGMKHEG